MTSDRPPKRPDPLRPPLCLHFVTRIYRERAPMISLPFNLQEAQRGEGPSEAFDLVGVFGRCCHCQDFAPVVDQTVLKLYRAFHIPDAVICEKLPRVRRKVQHLKENRPQTILNALASVIEAPRYREDDPCSEP